MNKYLVTFEGGAQVELLAKDLVSAKREGVNIARDYLGITSRVVSTEEIQIRRSIRRRKKVDA